MSLDRYKFRGKRLDNGEWVIGSLDLGCHDAFGDEHPAGIRLPNYHAIPVDPATVGQYTGRSIAGVEVYEGDKITFDWRVQEGGELYAGDSEGMEGVVEFIGRHIVRFQGMQFDLHEVNEADDRRLWREHRHAGSDDFFLMDNFKVIGSIHD